jgi:nucleoside-diphosphate-sugar epimerase
MTLRILVAGGSGLLGAPATRALVARGHDVSVMTRGTRPAPEGTAALVADRRDPAALAAALAGRRFDVVFDLLAYDGADVARLFAAPGFEVGRYLFVSSGQVYLVGAERRPPFREADAGLPVVPEPKEDTRDHANWVYGVGKRDAERAACELQARRGTRATALRLPVVHGAGDPSRRLWAYLQRLRDGGPLLLPEGGEHPVRFVWSQDVARAVVALAEGASAPAAAYNLAQPDEPRLRDFVAGAAAALGVRAHLVPCTWDDLAGAGLDGMVSPYSGPWCSRPDPSLALRDWGFQGTPSARWLPEVVLAHLAESDPEPHPGYAHRAAERALAARLGGA